MATITELIPAGESRRFNSSGKYFVLLSSSTVPAFVRFFNRFAMVDYVEGLGEGLRFVGDLHAVEFVAGAADCEVSFYVGENSVEYNAPPTGDVSVIGSVSLSDGDLAATLAGTRFYGGTEQAASAGNTNAAFVFNPAASGKNLIVDRLAIIADTAGAACYVRVSTVNFAYGTLQGQMANMLAGGADSVSQVRKLTQPLAPTVVKQLGYQRFGPMTGVVPFGDMIFDAPIVLPAGWGLAVVAMVVNSALRVDFYGREVAA